MLKINKKVEYALIALRYMSEKMPGELTTAKEICALYKSPFDVMARVLQIMAQHGVLKSEHGAHGGYLIQKDLSKITLLFLVEMILGPVKVTDCLRDAVNACDLVSSCNIVSPMVKLNDKLKTFYGSLSVKELILSPETRRARSNPNEHFVV